MQELQTEIVNEILQCIRKYREYQISIHEKAVRSKQLFDKLNEERKRRGKREMFSPTTYSRYIPAMVNEGLITAYGSTRKRFYDVNEPVAVQRALKEFAKALENFLPTFGDAIYGEDDEIDTSTQYVTMTLKDAMDLFPTWTELIEDMTDEQLTKLKLTLNHLAESINSYQKSKYQEQAKKGVKKIK